MGPMNLNIYTERTCSEQTLDSSQRMLDLLPSVLFDPRLHDFLAQDPGQTH